MNLPAQIRNPLQEETLNSSEFRRELTLLDSTMINIGSMVGSGIFIVPAMVALYLQSSLLIALAWILGGIVTLFGALSVAELGAMMPQAGGQYVYLGRAYSPLWGFLYGWASFLVINTGSIAAVAVTFAVYLGYFFPLTPVAIKIVAISSILLLTAVNCFGIKLGAHVQNAFTLAKMGALGALALLSFALTGGTISNLSPLLPESPLTSMTGPFALAMVAILWSYDGWIEITYVAGEVKDPQRNIPRSLLYSTLLVIFGYLLINAGYAYVLSVGEVSKATLVASDTATKIMGPIGASFVAGAVILSTFGTNNGFIFTCPRIYYAMAKDGVFFRWLAYLHPTYRTPIPSLIAQAVLASVLILSGTYEQLTTYVVFASFLFYALSAGGVMILRKKDPAAARPYRTWGYPITPVLFILFSVYLVMSSIIESPVNSLIGGVIIVAGVPCYLYWRRRETLL